MATNENTALSITAIVTKMISECKSNHLITQIATFMLGTETTTPETKEKSDHETRSILISRCDHISDELSITTLRLFEVLLHKTDKVVIENLIARNLSGRGYVQSKKEKEEAQNAKINAAGDIAPEEPEFEWDDTDVITPQAKSEESNRSVFSSKVTRIDIVKTKHQSG